MATWRRTLADQGMGTTYNRKSQKERRQYLRTHMTFAEKTLWYSLKKDQLGCKFRRQHGVLLYVMDFYCPELKLGIEVDGESHDNEDAKKYDARRQRRIEREGIRFLRFTDHEILTNPDKVVQKIQDEVMRLCGQRHHQPRG